MPDLPEWVVSLVEFLLILTVIYLFQRSRWGIRIMTRQSMRDQMEKEINDRLWDRIYLGKMPLKEATNLSNRLGELLDMPGLLSIKRGKFKLKSEIQRRLKAYKRTPKPTIPGEKPPQTITKNVFTKVKKAVGSLSLKLNGH